MGSRRRGGTRANLVPPGAERGQALIELALVVPLLLLLALAVVGIGRVTQARIGVSAVARDAARDGALAGSSAGAITHGMARGEDVAAGYGLGNGSLRLAVDASAFGRGGQVAARATYTVQFSDLPLLGWAQVPVASTHIEPVDPYRGRPTLAGGRQP